MRPKREAIRGCDISVISVGAVSANSSEAVDLTVGNLCSVVSTLILV